MKKVTAVIFLIGIFALIALVFKKNTVSKERPVLPSHAQNVPGSAVPVTVAEQNKPSETVEKKVVYQTEEVAQSYPDLLGSTNVSSQDRIHVQIKESSQEQMDRAKNEFHEFLKMRESNYPVVFPAQGMISVSNALSVATCHVRGGYDKTQKAKIELIGDVYKVTLWKHRKPFLSKTGFAAVVEIDAWSGKVVNLLLSSD